jgi:ubiquitin carboxyl-terminal hydrolase 14
LQPVSRRLLEIEKERRERMKVRKRTKAAREAAAAPKAPGEAPMDVDNAPTPEEAAADVKAGELEDESVYRNKELAELEALVDPSVRADYGASLTGLYELVGALSPGLFTPLVALPAEACATAIITHKGAAADAGHYIAFVKKSVFHPHAQSAADDAGAGPSNGKQGAVLDDSDDDWYKFDDDKVSTFPVEKLATLDGGGEDSSAYVLLYRSKELA